MELLYIWIEDYKNIKQQGFNFSPKCKFEFKNNILSWEKRTNSVSENFFCENLVNITGIVGKNGSGKSSLIEAIISKNDIRKFIVTDNYLIFSHIKIKFNFTDENFPIKIELEKSFMEIETYEFGKKTIEFDKLIINEWESIKKIEFKFNCIDWKLFNIKYESLFYEKIIYYSTFINYSFNTITGINDISTTNFLKTDRKSPLNYNTSNNDISFPSEFKAHHFENLKRQILFLNIFQNTEIPLPKAQFIYVKFNDFQEIFKDENKLPKNKDGRKELSEGFSSIEHFIEIISRLELTSVLNSDIEDNKKIGEETNLNWEERYIAYLSQQADNFDKGNTIRSYNWHKNLLENVNNFFKFIKHNREELSKGFEFGHYIQLSIVQNKELTEEFINLYSKCDFYGNFLSFSWNYNYSSGEKAFLNLFSSFFSIKNKDKNFVILIDEGETYFHPDWQRKFISILQDLKKTIFPNSKIQIILTSHSPFICSDLPKENIIFLDKFENEDDEVKKGIQKAGNCKVIPSEKMQQTFGQNIHTLLSDSFFLKDGLIGDFAKEKINSILELMSPLLTLPRMIKKIEIEINNEKGKKQKNDLVKTKKMHETDLLTYKNKFESEKLNIKKVIDIIGEPIVQDKLLQMYYAIETEDAKEAQIKLYKEKLKKLGHDTD